MSLPSCFQGISPGFCLLWRCCWHGLVVPKYQGGEDVHGFGMMYGHRVVERELGLGVEEGQLGLGVEEGFCAL